MELNIYPFLHTTEWCQILLPPTESQTLITQLKEKIRSLDGQGQLTYRLHFFLEENKNGAQIGKRRRKKAKKDNDQRGQTPLFITLNLNILDAQQLYVKPKKLLDVKLQILQNNSHLKHVSAVIKLSNSTQHGLHEIFITLSHSIQFSNLQVYLKVAFVFRSMKSFARFLNFKDCLEHIITTRSSTNTHYPYNFQTGEGSWGKLMETRIKSKKNIYIYRTEIHFKDVAVKQQC